MAGAAAAMIDRARTNTVHTVDRPNLLSRMAVPFYVFGSCRLIRPEAPARTGGAAARHPP